MGRGRPVSLYFADIGVKLRMAEGFDGIQAGGGDCRIHAEKDASQHGKTETQRDGPNGYNGLPPGDLCDGERAADAEGHADNAARGGKHHGFHKKLDGDLSLLGTQGSSDADFSRALRDGGSE